MYLFFYVSYIYVPPIRGPVVWESAFQANCDVLWVWFSLWFLLCCVTAPVHYIKLSRGNLYLSNEGVPGHLVSGADWMPGTARAPVSLSHCGDEAESYRMVHKEGGSGWKPEPHKQLNHTRCFQEFQRF